MTHFTTYRVVFFMTFFTTVYEENNQSKTLNDHDDYGIPSQVAISHLSTPSISSQSSRFITGNFLIFSRLTVRMFRVS